MKFTSAIVVINFIVSGVAPHWADATNLRAIPNKRSATDANRASANDEHASPPTIDGDKRRELQSFGCWGDKSAAWHPRYSMGWTEGYCRYTIDCNSPAYPSELACCKGAYAGQISGACLRRLPSPPTSSPTGKGGGLAVYYPDYGTAWPDAKCINDAPMPSGRPTYSTMLECCKGAYGGQVSGKCLASLPLPPTTSPTRAGGLTDFWYPDYDTPWAGAGCLNTLPLPYNNVNDRPNYPTQFACCKGAYGGQMSGICLRQLPSPPSTSPTLSGGQVDFWYPNYESPWDKAGCLNSLPLPYVSGGRPEYTSRVACCGGAYGGQTSKQCMCEAVGVCFACSCGTAKERCENNCSNLDCQDDHEDGCATLLANPTTPSGAVSPTVKPTTSGLGTLTITAPTTVSPTVKPTTSVLGTLTITAPTTVSPTVSPSTAVPTVSPTSATPTYSPTDECPLPLTSIASMDYIGNGHCFDGQGNGLYDYVDFEGISSGDICVSICSSVTNWKYPIQKGVGMELGCNTCTCLFEDGELPDEDEQQWTYYDPSKAGTGLPTSVDSDKANYSCFALPLQTLNFNNPTR